MDPPQDSFNETVSTLLERRIRNWLSGVIDDMRRSSPVQQWLDSLPVDSNNPDTEACDNITVENGKPEDNPCEAPSEECKPEDTNTEVTVIERTVKVNDNNLNVPSPAGKRKSLESGLLTSTPSITDGGRKKLQRDYSIQSEGYPPRLKYPLLRDHSLQSDGSGSSGSSVLNVLGARKVDAESVLLSLGFGPSEKQQKLQRIPDRFLTPSKLKGIDTEQFIKQELHSMRMHDCGVFGYRGLTGSPHVPPSTIVAKIIDCILQGEDCREEALLRARHSISDMPGSAAHVHLAPQLHNT